jgi:predicted nucleic acid-binding protein
MRLNRLTHKQGEAILTAYTDLQIPLATVSWQQIVPLARQFERLAYDAAYLGLAQTSNQPFITADKRLYNAIKAQLLWVQWLGDYQALTPATGESPVE